MGIARELVQEGVVIPPIRLHSEGTLREDVLGLILANVRTPDERRGDLRAQAAAHTVAEQRVAELVRRFGLETCWRKMAELMDYTERMTRLAIESIPDGTYRFEDVVDDDGFGTTDIRIAVTITSRGSELSVDFDGTSPLVTGSINATAAVTTAAVAYAVRCLLPRDVPANEGSMRPIRILLPEGSVVNAARPHAVSGSIETAQRVADTLLGALGKALPDLMPAASSGTMSNITFGGWNELKQEPYSYYETVAGGLGASPARPGADVVHAHMTNTFNTPIEMLEMSYPLRIHEYAVREGSGGAGRHRGGCGCRKSWEVLVPSTCSLLGDRRVHAPWGTLGGADGLPGRNILQSNGQERALGSKEIVHLQPGDVIVMETPGGGGWETA
jgi:N-methylhydantoinase B